MAAAGMRTWTDALANVHGLAAAAGKRRNTRGGSAVCWALMLWHQPACFALRCGCLVVPARPALHHRCPLNRPPPHPFIPADPAAPHILVGSHYDTVHDGGKFDGVLGVIAGIAAVKALLLEVGTLSLQGAELLQQDAMPLAACISLQWPLGLLCKPADCSSCCCRCRTGSPRAAFMCLPPCRLPWQRGLSALLHCKRQRLLQARASHSICPGCCLPEMAKCSSCWPHLCMWWPFQMRRVSGGQRRRHANQLSCRTAGWGCRHARVAPGQLAAADQACVLLQVSEHLPGQPRSGWQSGPRCVETPPFWSRRYLPHTVNADTQQCASDTACKEACVRCWFSWQQPCPALLRLHCGPIGLNTCIALPTLSFHTRHAGGS